MRALIIIAMLVGFLATAARAGDAVGAFAPYEDLLEVLAPVTWHLNDDLYRRGRKELKAAGIELLPRTLLHALEAFEADAISAQAFGTVGVAAGRPYRGCRPRLGT